MNIIFASEDPDSGYLQITSLIKNADLLLLTG